MDYKSTINLPKTDFPMKASLPEREPVRVQKWQNEKIYERMISKRKSKPMFLLHDGPPYANGNIHLGHTLNKVLKDIVIKYKNMSGFYSPYVPGWDCHGLPIELGVEKKLREEKKDKSTLSKVDIRKLCKQYADGWINKQRDQFKRLGGLGDWENPYVTMSDDYVANIVRELGRISKTGNLYKGNKPVYWCATCATALADAEIEYHDHKSPSIHVKFFFDEDSLKKSPELKKSSNGKPIALVIWTTTPWTLPANLAISLHPDFEYVGLDTGKEILVVADGLREKFITETGITANITSKIPAKSLERLNTNHPFMNRKSLVILGEHVTLEAGTGAVHTAPGHGVDDYRIGIKYGLEVLAPVDGYGKYTDEVPLWKGTKIFDANPLVIEQLKKTDHLVKVSEISHSYPHCWRCNKPVLFRATPQWFIGMEKTNLRERARAEINKVEWIPQWGINRILGMIDSRPDWCISRQRVWGVPITVFYCEKTGNAISSQESFNYIADLIEKNGPNIWYEWEASKLLKPGIKTDAGTEIDVKALRKETDILDVWFDSGVSHAAVLADPKRNLRWPADLYLEGSDQHRGWFQTSLLTAVEARGSAPFKRVLTHGFVNDADGKKMSKSKGNVTDPLEFSSKYGAEILRLWVVIEDYRNDVSFSMVTIERISETYRKVRNTLRYILGNIYDYKPGDENKHGFCELDLWAQERTRVFLEKLKTSYEDYEFHSVYHALVNFAATELSAQYFDIIKDRMYTSAKNSKERKSSQATLYKIGVALASALAPILSFTSEEVWEQLRLIDPSLPESVFEADFPTLDSFWNTNEIRKVAHDKIATALEFREVINKALEASRQAKEIGHPLEAAVSIHVPKDQHKVISTIQEDLARLYIVSKIEYLDGKVVEVKVKKADGNKCSRCWVYSTEVGKNSKHIELCNRCTTAVESQ